MILLIFCEKIKNKKAIKLKVLCPMSVQIKNAQFDLKTKNNRCKSE